MKRREKISEPMTIAEAQAMGRPVPSVRMFRPGTALDHGDAILVQTRWSGEKRIAVHPRARQPRRNREHA